MKRSLSNASAKGLAVLGALTILLAILAFLAFGISREVTSSPGYQELAEAGAWAYLQGVEAEHRGDHGAAAPKMLRGADSGQDYDVIGIPIANYSSPFVWIILNDHRPAGGIYSMPNTDEYAIACTYVRHLEGDIQLDPIVAINLTAHCK